MGLGGGGGGFGGAQGGVALVAHFLDLRGAFRVDGCGGRGDLVGEGEDGAVEGVEGGEVGGEEGGRGGEGFAGRVHLDGEEGECFVHCGGGGRLGWIGGAVGRLGRGFCAEM